MSYSESEKKRSPNSYFPKVSIMQHCKEEREGNREVAKGNIPLYSVCYCSEEHEKEFLIMMLISEKFSDQWGQKIKTDVIGSTFSMGTRARFHKMRKIPFLINKISMLSIHNLQADRED